MMKTDPGLKADVTSELAFDPSVEAGHIEVVVKDGVVTLSGHVATFGDKTAAVRAAGRVRGLRALTEAIGVRLSDGHKRADGDIAAAIRARFDWDPALADLGLEIGVKGGVVTLTGMVADGWQREAAAEHVARTMGVSGLDNAVTLRAGPANAMVRNAIRHAINRSILCDDNIEVHVADGIVHLTGTAQNWPHKQLAGAMAWAAVGTRDVLNEIRIH